MPPGDVLLVAGDITGRGRLHEVEDFDAWLAVQPYPLKIVVAGNHDFYFENHMLEAKRALRHAVYLQDEMYVIRPSAIDREGTWRIRVYGSPWQPRFLDWAFNLDRNSSQLRGKWRKIPAADADNGLGRVDVLVTHGPPYGILDPNLRDERAGDETLAEELKRIKPRLHVFGHLHSGYGRVEDNGTIFVNASMCDEQYEIHRRPIVVELTCS